MMGKAFRIFGLTALVGLMVWGGFSVAAAHGGGGGKSMCELKAAHEHHAVASMIRDLDLSDEQLAHLETIHDNLAQMPFGDGGHAAHLHRLVEHVHRGQLNSGAVRQMVDEHVEQLRQAAYQLGDGLVALLDSLNRDQQEILNQHLEHVAKMMEEKGHGHGDRHGHGDGHGHEQE